MAKSTRTFNNLKYREVQSANTKNLQSLDIIVRQFLKKNGYRNTGWENVINLYNKIAELSNENSLENLFLEVDRIGNKYLTPEEIRTTNQAISQVLNEIEDLIEVYFPDQDEEIIDFRKV